MTRQALFRDCVWVILLLAASACNAVTATPTFAPTATRPPTRASSTALFPGTTARPPTAVPPAPVVLVNDQSTWRYTTQPQWRNSRWFADGFYDGLWQTATLPLGNLTTARTRVKPEDPARAIFLRTTFDLARRNDFTSLTLSIEYRSGIVVFLNGNEIARAGLDHDAEPDEFSTAARDTPAEKMDVTFALTLLQPGRNTLALQVHRAEAASDLFISLELRATTRTTIANFVIAPMLGLIGRDTITLKTESDIPATGILEYRPTDGVTTTLTSSTALAHRVTLHALKPGTTYHYRFGLQTNAGTTWSLPGQWTTDGGAGQSFRFAVWADSRPLLGSAMPLVFKQMLDVLAQHTPLALGIAGGDNVQVYDAPLNERTLRDRYIAYFDALAPLARQMPLFPILGNHDGASSDLAVRAFRQNFLLPDQNDQTYYSFNYGDVHFVLLNNEQMNGRPVGRMSDAQWQWLEQDLAGTQQPIVIVISHNAIFGGLPTRPRFTPAEVERLHRLFKQYGVVAVFQGDSHYYNFAEQDGIAYFVTGGAGSPLYGHPTHPAWSTHQVLLIEIVNRTLISQALQPDGSILDRRVIPLGSRVP